jgi:fructose-bisphosphate aldolase class II
VGTTEHHTPIIKTIKQEEKDMLITMKAILELAEVKNIAIGAFNITSLEGIQAVLEASEELNQPVILQFAPVHEAIIPMKVIGPIMLMMAERASVPVAVHLDHGDDLSILKKALDMGFTSVMYDGSALSFEENAANTRIAVEMAGTYGHL